MFNSHYIMKFNNAKISVIIPTYNSARYICETIDSVLSQTYKNFEILVIDDGSTDNTRNRLKQYENSINYTYKKNEGVSIARNYGIEKAKGEYLAFLDSDDIWKPTKLEKQINTIENQSEAIACFTLTEYFDESGNVVNKSEFPNYADLTEALLLYSCVIGPPSSFMMHRSIFEKIGGFDPNFSQCADWDMWLRLTKFGKVICLDEYLVQYRHHANNMSKNIELLEKDTIAVLNKFFANNSVIEYENILNETYSNNWLMLSGSYLHIGSVSKSLKCLVKGIRFYPQNLYYPLRLPRRWLGRLFLRNN